MRAGFLHGLPSRTSRETFIAIRIVDVVAARDHFADSVGRLFKPARL
jgi:hypothetical protein